MKKRWTDEEIAILKAHFETTSSVYDLVPMLPGRDYTNIRKKANSIGLRRPDLKDLSHAKLMDAIGAEKLSVKEIARRLGYHASSVNFLLRRAHDEGLCHIADHRTHPGAGKCTPLWVAGKGQNVPSHYAIEKARKDAQIVAQHEQERNRPVRRDPFIELMFGCVG